MKPAIIKPGRIEPIYFDFDTHYFDDIDDGLKILDKYSYAVSSGSDGSVDVWVDDDSKYRGEFSRFRTVISYIETRSSDELIIWLNEYLKKQY
ncbi:hypothetical protein [Photorhabdus luminescens]|uniref:Uncharacterized protein n=1 Tax=Photorhabdus luminescens subsp. sonorensis TaxID=1173677 RepID=A0A5C4RJR2_PHOLU|nr:hypothetical protein [Photorhabdus luminescens]TNH43797.1 hypothetical protein EP164_09635 [Photorhabdus luminescens subsp. sonorensis]